MKPELVSILDEAQCEELGAFLADRIYEFNAKETGYFDGMLLAGCIRSESGEVIAGYNGHTWGGCCELAHVWVDEHHRGRGLGALLLRSAEAEAAAKAAGAEADAAISKRLASTSGWDTSGSSRSKGGRRATLISST